MATQFDAQAWVREEYNVRHGQLGHRPNSIKWVSFANKLVKKQPHNATSIRAAVKRLQSDLTMGEKKRNEETRLEQLDSWLHQQYLEEGFSRGILTGFKGWAKFEKIVISQKPHQEDEIRQRVAKLRNPGLKFSFPDVGETASRLAAEQREQKKVQQCKANNSQQNIAPIAFRSSGWVGKFTGDLAEQVQEKPKGIQQTSQKTQPKSKPPASHSQGAASSFRDAFPGAFPVSRASSASASTPVNKKPKDADSTFGRITPQAIGIPANHVDQAEVRARVVIPDSDSSDTASASDNSEESFGDIQVVSDNICDLLLTGDTGANEDGPLPFTDISHAPVISGDVLRDNNSLLRQYGLLGTYLESGSRAFQNTTVPFATFVCGVQGSGKSHTTACLIENALIPVPAAAFGRLEGPLSALVFAYDDFNGDGSGFSISEAASLAAPHPAIDSRLRVKKITVLVSPSNPVIRRIYGRLPNVTVIPFKLNPRTLTVKTILTLMAVDESAAVPLYLAKLTEILRKINIENDGCFDFAEFKRRLKLCDFNPAQENMLQLRLDLLESFLDLSGRAPQPSFAPGEITIMDMSCPFVDPNTACILFKLGLETYMNSAVAGKMVVLDEAHKYMLNVPGAKALNHDLIKLIRLQRHKGVRTIIATQEPTLLTDLIALCDLTVMHRFSSPEWFAALKKHIPMAHHDKDVLLDDIEGLTPGTALVYSAKSILGYDDDGSLVSGTGKLVKLKVRGRITRDGGQSVLAV